MVQPILPEILLLILTGLVMAFDAVWSEEQRRNLGWLTFGGLVVVISASLLLSRPGDTGSYEFGGMVRHDGLTFTFKYLFLFGAAITTLFVVDSQSLGKRGEFYVLMLVSTIGMNLMASAGDLIMLYLA